MEPRRLRLLPETRHFKLLPFQLVTYMQHKGWEGPWCSQHLLSSLTFWSGKCYFLWQLAGQEDWLEHHLSNDQSFLSIHSQSTKALATIPLRTSSNTSFSKATSSFPSWPRGSGVERCFMELSLLTIKPAVILNAPRAAALNYYQELNFRRWHRQKLSALTYELIISCILRSHSTWENKCLWAALVINHLAK